MTVHQLHRAPLSPVQGTLALDLTPRLAPPPAPAPAPGAGAHSELDRWVHRYVQTAVEIVGGDRPASQLLRWTSGPVHVDLHRRALLVARAGGHQPGVRRVQPVRPQVVSVVTSRVGAAAVEASARVRYGARSRAVALRLERRSDRWVCTALEFA